MARARASKAAESTGPGPGVADEPPAPPPSKPPPRLATIHFEAALPPTGKAFTLDADGEARFTMVVSPMMAKPLAAAMAGQALNGTTFLIALSYPDDSPAP